MTQTTPEKIEQALGTVKEMEHEISCLRRDRLELVRALKELIESSPSPPDTTKEFLKANQFAARLIQKFDKQN